MILLNTDYGVKVSGISVPIGSDLMESQGKMKGWNEMAYSSFMYHMVKVHGTVPKR